ncbi:MFS transporter [Blautia sp.]|uniref:MFS transporter n=1 Tax=Blautia sp. TaxID=1955243 RepID=UPI003AB62573
MKSGAKNNNVNELKIGWGTRIAYGCGDTACNVVFGMISTLLTLFYTDYVGISAATVGLVMLLSRAFDGVSDAVMGVIVEKTKSKWGKARPWILWMSIPYAVCAVLLFTVPQTKESIQFLYMFVTYNLVTTVCYTAINLPYSSLSALMTRSSMERDMLSIVRMGISPFGRILAVTCTMPVVKLFGDDQAAWAKTMALWAVIALILLIICFLKCEEKVEIKAKEKQEKVPLGKALKALVTNAYFWAVVILWTMQNGIYCITGTILPYYCKYIFENDTWMYSALYLTETLLIVAVTFFSPILLKRFGKRNMSLAGVVLALAGQILFFVNPYSFRWMLLSCIIRAIGLAPLNSVVFGFLGDVVEYGQWKTHLRQESLIFAGSSVGMKVGAGLTSAIITGLLSGAGYVSSATGGVVQPESAVEMIVNIYKVGPMVVWVVVLITLLFYKLDKKYPIIMEELMEREARGEM